jgi:hypothetical protein
VDKRLSGSQIPLYFFSVHAIVSTTHTPLGAMGNYVLLPIALLMLVWCLWSGNRTAKNKIVY